MVGKVNDHGLEALRKSIEPTGTGTPHEYRVRTSITNEAGDGFSITDSAITQGVNGMRTTTLEVNDTAQKIPSVPLPLRNTISIQNFSPTSTIYIGTKTGLTAGRTIGSITDGTEIGPFESWNYAINEASEMYAIANTGQTAIIKITETA